MWAVLDTLAAVREGYGLLKALGCSSSPRGDVWLESRKRSLMCGLLWGMANLAASDHCRSAAEKMQRLDRTFKVLRRQTPGFSMPAWEALRCRMSLWEERLSSQARCPPWAARICSPKGARMHGPCAGSA